MLPLIMAIAGVVKSQQDKEDQMRKERLQAIDTRYSPWTHFTPNRTPIEDKTSDDIFSGLGAGAKYALDNKAVDKAGNVSVIHDTSAGGSWMPGQSIAPSGAEKSFDSYQPLQPSAYASQQSAQDTFPSYGSTPLTYTRRKSTWHL